MSYDLSTIFHDSHSRSFRVNGRRRAGKSMGMSLCACHDGVAACSPCLLVSRNDTTKTIVMLTNEEEEKVRQRKGYVAYLEVTRRVEGRVWRWRFGRVKEGYKSKSVYT